MKRFATIAAGLVLVLGSTIAVGQVIYNSASTAGEGYARGIGAVIQAQGDRNLSNSQAAINATEARSNQIDNQIKSVNAFWEKNAIYQQHVEEKLANIGQKRSDYLSRHGLGNLTSEEFDRSTGKINWLKVLDQKQYDPYRNKLEELLQARAYQGALTGEQYMQAAEASKQWRAMLAAQRDIYPQPILSQMIRFVLKVDREINDNLG